MNTDTTLWNEDLAPARERHWGAFSLFAMWMSDVHSVGGYTFAASLFLLGLTGWQTLAALILGICIVHVLMNRIGRPSQRYGIPYPVVARLSFGVRGANLAAVLRGVVGIVWYGVQTYFASRALLLLVVQCWPASARFSHGGWLRLSALGWACFTFMWLFQLLIFLRGMEVIRRFTDVCGPAVYAVMTVLAGWMLLQAGPSSLSLSLSPQHLGGLALLGGMARAAMLVVAYFAPLLLNFGDFARFSHSDAAMRRGNLLGLPLNFTAFSLIVVVVTSCSVKLYGAAVMDPVELVGRIHNPWAVAVGAVTFVIATMGINIVANFVSPAYDISNLAPSHINFRLGGLITSVLSVAVCPWLFVQSAQAVTLFVGVFGAALGPMFGIIVADFYRVRAGQVVVGDLYRRGGAYEYTRGWNRAAVVALLAGGAVALAVAFAGEAGLGPFGWVLGAAVAAATYLVGMRR